MTKRSFTQLKQYSRNLQLATVKKVVQDFKNIYYNSSNKREIGGFELTGGPGMSSGAEKVWDDFRDWCEAKGMFAMYLTQDDLNTIEINLETRLCLKNGVQVDV